MGQREPLGHGLDRPQRAADTCLFRVFTLLVEGRAEQEQRADGLSERRR